MGCPIPNRMLINYSYTLEKAKISNTKLQIMWNAINCLNLNERHLNDLCMTASTMVNYEMNTKTFYV